MGSDDEVVESGHVRGEVIEELPSALYRIALSDRREILASVAERRGMDFLRILPGDQYGFGYRLTMIGADELLGRIRNESQSISEATL